MGVERTFLGWERPFLHGVADWLIEARGSDPVACSLDLERFTVVMPSRSASRRLQEILLERAEAGRGLLVPPRALTPRALVDTLLGIQGCRLEPLEAELVMTCALRDMEAEEPHVLRALVRHPPTEDQGDGWATLAARFVGLRDEVAGAGRGFDVDRWPEAAQPLLDVGHERQRWATVQALMERYEGHLRAMARRDWVMAFEAPEADHGIERLILAGVSDLFPAAAQLVQGVTGQGLQVDALVRAPMELAESFDGLGCLDVGAWLEHRLDIPDETIHQVDGPVDQARAVVAAVGSLGGAFDVAEISVALANPGLAPFVEDELAGRGVATRYAGGRPAGRTAPYLLLSEVARYVDGQPFEALTSLARHPDLSTASEVLTGLDAYATEHLPSRTPREGQGPGERPGDPSWMVGRRRHVNRAVKRVGQLCGALAEGRPMTLPEVGEAILETLRDAYKATTFDQARREGRARLMALEELQKAAQSCGQLSPALVNAIGARAPGPLLRMLLRHAAERAVPDPENPAAIEMSDWLEVVLDDAPVLVIAGLNEGFVPQSVHGDPILPDRLRAALGITHNDLRMARDAHAMSAMLAERAERGFLAIITGRFDADREPLVPSRLLLRGSRPGDVIARTRRLFAPAGATRGSRHPSLAHASAGPGLPRIIPQAGETLDGDSLSVTDFKRYLACPYRFWLWRVKRLEVRDDTARELSAAGFGNLIHACLEAFGSDEELRACSDAAVIERALLHHLDHTVELLFGSDARRAVAIQAAVARRRLQAFAHAQAARVAEGWRQVLVEKTFSKTDKLVALPVEGAPFYVHGRIDRVDIHEDGRLAVLDYKTGPSTPDQDHRKGLQNSKRWVNLQLPLYRLMAAALEIPHESVITGYGILPSDPTKSRFLMAEWDAEALEEADALAVEVATQIRAGVFWPPSPHPPRYTDGLEGLCQEGALNAQSVAAPDGGP